MAYLPIIQQFLTIPYLIIANNKNKAVKEKAENSNNTETKADAKDSRDECGVSGTSVPLVSANKNNNNNTKKSDKIEDRILKPPPQFGGDMEMKQLAMVISREIYQESPNIHFDDIVKLDEAKRLLAEAVQLPLKFPSLFTGILRPWKGILLHGPPGNVIYSFINSLMFLLHLIYSRYW